MILPYHDSAPPQAAQAHTFAGEGGTHWQNHGNNRVFMILDDTHLDRMSFKGTLDALR